MREWLLHCCGVLPPKVLQSERAPHADPAEGAEVSAVFSTYPKCIP